jgi:hypothetical protein
MKKTKQSSRRRLVLAHETLRKLRSIDLAPIDGGGGAINTGTQGSLNRECSLEQSVCDDTCPTRPTQVTC